MSIDWLPGVFSATAAYLALAGVIWKQAALQSRPAQDEFGEAGDGDRASGNVVYGAFYTIYFNRRGRVSLFRSVLVTLFWVLFFAAIGSTIGVQDNEVWRIIYFLVALNFLLDFISVSQTAWLIRRFAGRWPLLLLVVIDVAVTTAITILACVTAFLLEDLYSFQVSVGFDPSTIWTDILVGLEVGMGFYELPLNVAKSVVGGKSVAIWEFIYFGAMVSTYASTFWLMAISLFSIFTGAKANSTDPLDREAAIVRTKMLAKWLLLLVITCIYGGVVYIEITLAAMA